MGDTYINIELNDDNMPEDIFGVAEMMVEQIKQNNPTIEDWEILKVAFSNSAIVLNRLADQEIEKLKAQNN